MPHLAVKFIGDVSKRCPAFFFKCSMLTRFAKESRVCPNYPVKTGVEIAHDRNQAFWPRRQAYRLRQDESLRL